MHDGIVLQISSPGLKVTANHLRNNSFQLVDRYIRSDVLTNIRMIIGVDHLHRYLTGVTSVKGMQL